MKIETSLPLSHMAFRHWHVDDSEVGIVLAKARFVRRDDGRLVADAEAPALQLEDVFAPGEAGFAELKQEQDIHPTKPATDLIVRAIARPPDGEPRQQWKVAVEVVGRLCYEFVVRGPSEWRRGLGGWRLGEAQPVDEVPLRYALAYGGRSPGAGPEDPPEVYEMNPAGQGFATKARLDGREPFAAPQIGFETEFASGDPAKRMAVVGTAPIAKAWLPRRASAGTFDEHWETDRHPRMPVDYDLRFWNCANVGLQAEPPLRGDEVLRLAGLSTRRPPLELPLPGVGLTVHAQGAGDTAEMPMQIATVDVDVQAHDPARHAVTILWSLLVPQPDRWPDATIEAVRLAAKQSEEA